MTKGKIYIASMNLRGKHAKMIDENSIKINVTSAQAKNNKNRLDFSPMTPVEGGYKNYWNFESYWQSGKVFEGIPEKVSKAWWRSQKTPKRRFPKAKNHKVLYAHFDNNPLIMDYITSRKKVYVSEYYELIKNREMTKYWKNIVNSGKSITIYDFDGPRTENGDVTCLEVTKELLINKINNEKFPFGHGYIVAGLLADIEPQHYIN